MHIKSWGFADGNGHEIARGWQGSERAAAERAQREANERGVSVDYWDENGPFDDEGLHCITVEPEPNGDDK